VPAPTTATSPAPISTPTPSQKPSQDIAVQKQFLHVETSDRDFTSIPTELDSKFESLDEDAALHSLIISSQSTWTKKYRTSLLSAYSTENLSNDGQKIQKNKAFDLLDALSRSGSLGVDCAELHVVIGASHNFDKNIINTLVQESVNPIEKVERSLLIVATTIQEVGAEELVKPLQLERVSTYSPTLFGLPSQQERLLLEEKV